MRTSRWAFVAVLAVVLCCAGSAGAIPTLRWEWTAQPGSTSSIYYLNNNLDAGGVLAGQIGYGVRHYDADGTQLHTVNLGSDTSKSAVRLGDYYFVTGANSQGIGRLDATGANAWNASSWVGFVNPGSTGPESIVTDGSWLFTNNDGIQNRIHAYSVSNAAGSFTLTEQWHVDLPAGGRVRGMSYDPGSGFIYVHNGGGDGLTYTDLYAISVGTQEVYNMGTHNEPGATGGTTRTYEVLRYGGELLTVGLSDMLSVYDVVGDTLIAGGGPKAQIDLGLGDLYGAAIIAGTPWDTLVVTSYGGKISGFKLVPEPTTLSLLGLGALALVRRRRKR